MRELHIHENEAGQRFDKYLAKLFRSAPKGFYYKMLRKKNITLNGGKAQGNERLCVGDRVCLYISDETFEKFSGQEQKKAPRASASLDIVYEDRDVALIAKPAGMLSQPGKDGTPSLVEYFTGYLLESGSLTEEALFTFRPSVCNRLDRNTSGLVAAGKSLAGLQELSGLFRRRDVRKFYLCLVYGQLHEKEYIRGYLRKDEKRNKVTVYTREREDAVPIETRYQPVCGNESYTLLLVELITGRPHQIRAHLASEGHGVVGDTKYAPPDKVREIQRRYSLRHQLLHGWKLVFPEMEGRLAGLSGKSFTAPLPEEFRTILREEGLYENLEGSLGICENDHHCGTGGPSGQ
ncbi:MAG: RluA family pseudouridine synthase [Clostridiales bacterium]|nr:RluA family pseudouridine synthase [Clostridiales bacterium]